MECYTKEKKHFIQNNVNTKLIQAEANCYQRRNATRLKATKVRFSVSIFMNEAIHKFVCVEHIGCRLSNILTTGIKVQ